MRTASRPRRSRDWWTPATLLMVVDLVLGLGLRVGLSLGHGRDPYDHATFMSWATTLRAHGPGGFYSHATAPDHLPGDVWFLWMLVRLNGAFGGDLGHGFEVLLQVLPIAADLSCLVLLTTIVWQQRGAETARTTWRWWLLCPVFFVVSGLWSQWDPLSFALLLLGLLWALRGDAWHLAASVPFTWALLIKPQLTLPALILWAAAAWTWPARRVLHAGMSAALAVCWSAVLVVPFRVGLWWAPDGGGGSLASRIAYATGAHPRLTSTAANFWLLHGGVRAAFYTSDSVEVLGIRASLLGLMGTFAAVIVTAVVAWRSYTRGSELLVTATWLATTTTLFSFMLLTRVHERYIFPVIGLMLLWTALRGSRLSRVTFWTGAVAASLNVALAGSPRDGVYWPALALYVVTLVLLFAENRGGSGATLGT